MPGEDGSGLNFDTETARGTCRTRAAAQLKIAASGEELQFPVHVAAKLDCP